MFNACTKSDLAHITGPIKTVICGGVGGTILWASIFPTDVVKSRIQINKLNTTMLACMQDIVRKEGNLKNLPF